MSEHDGGIVRTTEEKRGIKRRRYLGGVASTAAIAGLSGCIGTLTGTDESGADTITIGATVPRTGRLSSLGQDLERGYELGVQRMNENGGIDGTEVELVVSDDKSEATNVRTELQQIVDNNDVNLLWGSFSSPLVTAGSAFAEQEELPFLGIAFAHMEPHRTKGYDYTYAPFPKSRDMVAGTVETLNLVPEDQRPTNVGIWELNSGWGVEMADLWESELTSRGYEVVLRERYNIGNDDFSTLISQSANADVEVLLSNPTPPDGITAMKQMRSSGFTPKFLEFIRAPDPEAWWSALESTANYAMFSPGWVPGLTGNGNQRMRDAYYDTYDVAEDSLIPVMVGTSYNLTQVAEQALGAAASFEPEDINEALRTEQFQTVISEFGFDEFGMPAEGQMTAPTGMWWNGDQRVVYPDVDQENALDLKYPMADWSER